MKISLHLSQGSTLILGKNVVGLLALSIKILFYQRPVRKRFIQNFFLFTIELIRSLDLTLLVLSLLELACSESYSIFSFSHHCHFGKVFL